MKFVEESALNNRPHPGPLPRGEGAAGGCFVICGRTSGKSSGAEFRVTANPPTSPGGEGECFN
jgi:hypothetical protein